MPEMQTIIFVAVMPCLDALNLEETSRTRVAVLTRTGKSFPQPAMPIIHNFLKDAVS
jgi:hypothetical protein